MNNIDIRKYIINNFKNTTIEEIKASIEESIEYSKYFGSIVVKKKKRQYFLI